MALEFDGSRTLPALWLVKSLPLVDWAALVWAGGGYIALFAVTAMTLLLGLMAIEVEAKIDVDLDHELRLNGIANLLVGACGGMTGTLSMSRTVLNYRAGGRHRASGILAGAICLLTLAFGTRALGFIPVPILGGLLLQLGADLPMTGWSRVGTQCSGRIIFRWRSFSWSLWRGILSPGSPWESSPPASPLRLIPAACDWSDWGSIEPFTAAVWIARLINRTSLFSTATAFRLCGCTALYFSAVPTGCYCKLRRW